MWEPMFITPFNGHRPQVAPTAFVDISARFIGRVTVEENASIWPGAVLPYGVVQDSNIGNV